MPVKNARKFLILKRRKAREAEGKFLIEGIRLSEEALRSDAPVEQMVFCREILKENERMMRLFRDASERDILVQQTDHRAMRGMCETQTPQGVLGIVQVPKRDRDQAVLAKAPLLLLDRLRDPGNLGLILRTAEAAGAGALLLTPGSVEPYNPKAVRASMGSIFRLPIFPNERPIPLLTALRARGIRVLSAHTEGTPFHRVKPRDRFALVLGNEAFGVDPALIPFIDETVSIPMAAPVESLNVAVAAGILLYEFQDHQGTGPIG